MEKTNETRSPMRPIVKTKSPLFPLPPDRSKYKTINLHHLEIIARLGWTDNQMADFFQIQIETFKRYKKKKEFSETLKKAKAIPDRAVVASLFTRAIGFSHPDTIHFSHNGTIISKEIIKYYPPDPASMIFWLKNRMPTEWRDTIDQRHAGTVEFTQGKTNNDAYTARQARIKNISRPDGP